jgi:hypothetical protein
VREGSNPKGVSSRIPRPIDSSHKEKYDRGDGIQNVT